MFNSRGTGVQSGLVALAIVVTAGAAFAQSARRPGASEPIPSIEERTTGMKKIDGFFPLYWEAGGRLFLEIPRLNTEVLYSTGLATGLGSNDIGLDRGILTGSRIIKFERAGPCVLMVQPNYQFRAMTTSEAEARTVRDVCPFRALGMQLPPRPETAWWSTTPNTSSGMATTWRDGSVRAHTDSKRAGAPLHADDPRLSEEH